MAAAYSVFCFVLLCFCNFKWKIGKKKKKKKDVAAVLVMVDK